MFSKINHILSELIVHRDKLTNTARMQILQKAKVKMNWPKTVNNIGARICFYLNRS